MTIQKKDVIILVLSICLISTTTGSVILGTLLSIAYDTASQRKKEVLIVGTLSGPVDLDPVDSWDRASWDILTQCVEGLFFYNVSDPDLPLTPWLASDYTWVDSITLDISLRTGVTFHDGTAFNADAVIWNFRRLLHFMNHTGTLLGGLALAKIHSLFEFADGSPIIADVVKIGELLIQIQLNRPYTPILGLLAFTATGMISPPYHEAQGHLEAYIDTSSDKIVGTGPYEYVEYLTDDNVTFTDNPDYWMEPVMFDELIFDIIDDSTIRNYALLAGEIDYLFGSQSDLWDTFEENPFTHYEAIDRPGLSYSYLAMNNKQINITWRKAISYAFNYAYILENWFQGSVTRSYGPVSPGFAKYYDDDLKEKTPYHNLTIARQTLIDDPGVNTTGLTASDNPDDLAWEEAHLRELNYSYNPGGLRDELAWLLPIWLADIGIDVIDGLADWAYFLYRAYGYIPGGYDELQIFWVSWGPDYLDPMNMIYPLLSNDSVSNSAQVNDSHLQSLIEAYMSEPVENIRIELIKEISIYLVTELYPHVFGYHYQTISVHAADLNNVAYNVAGAFWAYPIKRNLTWSPW
jgi:peptide/nickel transport system substrate-binding protein